MLEILLAASDARGSVSFSDLIQAASALLGAIVGGLFVMLAARSQWHNDRRLAREETARQAAKSLTVSLAQLEGAVATWLAGGIRQDNLARAFNAFSVAAVSEAPFIDNNDVRHRVNEHVELAAMWIRAAAEGQIPQDVLEQIRVHADAVTAALEAYVRNVPLPTYHPLPKQPNGVLDIRSFLTWRPN